MNSINFLGKDNFPWSSDTFDFLQNMVLQLGNLASIGGGTYILSGCKENGLQVSSGFVVIDGEILPFVGGAKQKTVYISETRRDVHASGYQFPEVYKTRMCEFGIGTTQYTWSSFQHIETNAALAATLADLKKEIEDLQGIPKGIITMWSGSVDNIPKGWSLCDGLQGRPNLSGRFVVGLNPNDSDYNKIGNAGGEKEVSLSVTQLPKHEHDYLGTFESHRDWKSGGSESIDNFTVSHGTRTTSPTGGGMPHENRPPYYVLAYIIKL